MPDNIRTQRKAQGRNARRKHRQSQHIRQRGRHRVLSDAKRQRLRRPTGHVDPWDGPKELTGRY